MSRLTASGTFTGTLAYSAPEQIRGERPDARSDLYALGCVAYECLTGVAPFVRDDQAALLFAHLEHPPPPVSRAAWDLAPADPVLARALAKRPDERFQSGAAFIEALAPVLLGERGAARLTAMAETAPRAVARTRDTPGNPPAAPVATTMAGTSWTPSDRHGGARGRPSARRAGRFPGRRTTLVAAALAAVLATTGFLVLRPESVSSETSVPVSLPFALETYDNGVQASRTWTLNAAGDHLHAEVILFGGGKGATYDEVIPKSLADSADDVVSDPPPEKVVRRDPVLRYRAPQTKDGRATLTYDIEVAAGPASLSRLEAWAADQRRERGAYLESIHEPPPVTLAVLRISPDRLPLTLRSAPHLLSLTGEDSRGRPVPPGDLTKARWSSSAPGVASVDRRGLVTPRGAGATTVVAVLGSIRAESTVEVAGPERASADSSSPPDGSSAPAGACAVGQNRRGEECATEGNGGRGSSGSRSPTSGSKSSVPPVECADGVANDGSGLADFPDDAGCSGPGDDTEWTPPTECADGVDNDGNGLIDYPADPGCSDAGDGEEWTPPTECADGVDNDGNGLTDYPADPGCSDPQDPTEETEPSPVEPEVCDDGVDNDTNGLVDGEDPACATSSETSDPPPPSPAALR
jgi:hypothetical protein